MDIPGKDKVEIKFEENLPIIEYPPFSLKRILSNLITNAVKYTPEDRTPVIEIGCEEKDIFYQISVKDHGAGIKADDVEKVFYPLYRAREMSNVRGSGLACPSAESSLKNTAARYGSIRTKARGAPFISRCPKV